MRGPGLDSGSMATGSPAISARERCTETGGFASPPCGGFAYTRATISGASTEVDLSQSGYIRRGHNEAEPGQKCGRAHNFAPVHGTAGSDGLIAHIGRSAFDACGVVSLDLKVPGAAGELRNLETGGGGVCYINHLRQRRLAGSIVDVEPGEIRQGSTIGVLGRYAPRQRRRSGDRLRHGDRYRERIERRRQRAVAYRDNDVRVSARIGGAGRSA